MIAEILGYEETREQVSWLCRIEKTGSDAIDYMNKSVNAAKSLEKLRIQYRHKYGIEHLEVNDD